MAVQSWRRAGVSCRADVTGKVRTAAHHSPPWHQLLCPESFHHAWRQHVLLTDGCKHVQLGNLAEHQSCLFKSSPADREGVKSSSVMRVFFAYSLPKRLSSLYVFTPWSLVLWKALEVVGCHLSGLTMDNRSCCSWGNNYNRAYNQQ